MIKTILDGNKQNINLKLETLLSLSNQCYFNEYIFFIEETEKDYVEEILSQLRKGTIDEFKVAILSCYYPIRNFIEELPLLKKYKSKSNLFQKLLEEQLHEPELEFELSKIIPKIGLIKDQVSKKVMEQYQENPYPRWKYGYGFIDKKYPIRPSINNDISPNSIEINSKLITENPFILIAGCGTGQQILQAQRYKNAEITAIDLSKSSLSYAKRKINELRVNNVNIIQMDLKNVHLLNVEVQ